MIFNLFIPEHCAFSSRNLGRGRASLRLLTALSLAGRLRKEGVRVHSRRQAGGDGRGSTGGPAHPPHKRARPCMSGSEPIVSFQRLRERAALSGLGHQNFAVDRWVIWGQRALRLLPRAFPRWFILRDKDRPRPRTDFVGGGGVDRVATWAFSMQETESSAGESLL